MDGVNKTLYIPLYAKAFVSRKGLFLKDKKAEEIWSKEGFALKGKAKSKWLAYYLGIRASVFDEWVKERLTEDAAVIHIGCGLDGRALRVGTETGVWYDLDFPEVIKERKRYYAETEKYQMLADDAREVAWLKKIPQKTHALVVMEGVSMYLTNEEWRNLTAQICARFDKVSLLTDCYTPFAVKASKWHNPINAVGVTQVCGVADPIDLQNGDLAFEKELEMIPQKYVDELHGLEKWIFARVYAGKISKKLYKLFAYKK